MANPILDIGGRIAASRIADSAEAFGDEFVHQWLEAGQNVGLADRAPTPPEILQQRREHPVATYLGNVAADSWPLIRPAAMRAGIPGALTTAVGSGAIGYATRDPGTPGWLGIIEGIAGETAGNLTVRALTKGKEIAKGIARNVPDTGIPQVQRLEQAGFEITPYNRGDKGWGNFETSIDARAATADLLDKLIERNNVRWNQALADAADVPMSDGRRFTRPDLETAIEKSGANVALFADALPPEVELGGLSGAVRNFVKGDKWLRQLLEDDGISFKGKGEIILDADSFMRLRSTLLQNQRQAYKAGGEMNVNKGMMVGRIIDRMDGLVEDVIDPAAYTHWRQASDRYAFLKALDKGRNITHEGPRGARSLAGNLDRHGSQIPEIQKALQITRDLSTDDMQPLLNFSNTSRKDSTGVRDILESVALLPAARAYIDPQNAGRFAGAMKGLRYPTEAGLGTQLGGGLGRGLLPLSEELQGILE